MVNCLWCLCMLYLVAMLQSKLSRAAGPWTQHAPCPFRPRTPLAYRRKHSERHQPLRFSAAVSLSRQSQIATLYRPTSRSGISSALGELAANVISAIRGTATQHPPFGGVEHGVRGDDRFDVHMAHATGTGSLCSLGQCGHALGTLRVGWQVLCLSD